MFQVFYSLKVKLEPDNKPSVEQHQAHQPCGSSSYQAAIRKAASNPNGEITQADWDKVTELFLTTN